MKIIKPDFGGACSNSYILTADGITAVVIDASSPQICAELEKRNLICKAVLLTHGHFDHVGGCAALQNKGAEIYCGADEKPLIFSKEYLGIFGGVSVPGFEVSHTFKDGDNINLCGMNFTAISTAGHTKGSMCFVVEDNIFSGDTLFCGGVGRWDLPTGNFSALINSLKKLAAIDGDYKVFCGHGENTTLTKERADNPYFKY